MAIHLTSSSMSKRYYTYTYIGVKSERKQKNTRNLFS